MSDEHKPMTDDELDAIQGRLNAITQPPWKNYNSTYYGMVKAGEKEVAVASYFNSLHEDCRVTREDQAANAAFIAHAPDDIARLLAEVERLRQEKEILEETLDFLGIFVRDNLNYCPADFIGEGIDVGAEFTCKTEYDPDNGCQKCYDNCWADVFRKTAEEEIKALKELEKENAE